MVTDNFQGFPGGDLMGEPQKRSKSADFTPTSVVEEVDFLGVVGGGKRTLKFSWCAWIF